MRIEKVCFCNLNSLAGTWEVDFTHSSYTGEGLFAITGPTGAGKTTILDAICLALYGSTPRLGGVSGGANEIMTRRTGECWAEVVFATHNVHYCCKWSQNRAGKRADGKLQEPRRSFGYADADKPLETSIRRVNKAVEDATGLSYDRFIRTVLLAQGGFDAFLRSEESQRAAILESLTGTDIYRAISKKVFEQHKAEKQKLENLQYRLEGIRLLSPEDEAGLLAGLEQKKAQEVSIKAEQDTTRKGLDWLRRLAALRGELTRLEADKTALCRQIDEFLPERQALRRAEKARELRPDFIALDAEHIAQQRAQAQLDGVNADLPVRNRNVAEAEQAGIAAENAVAVARKALADALPLLREAGKLDVQLKEKDTRIQADRAAFADAQKARSVLQNSYDRHVKEQVDVQARLTTLRQEMDACAADKELVTVLTGLEERFANVRREHSRLETGRAEESKARAQAVSAENAHQRQLAATAAAEKAETEARTRFESRQKAIDELLQGRELAAWREDLTHLGTTRTRLETMRDVLGQQSVATRKQLELQAAAKILQEGVQAREGAMAEAVTRLNELEAQRVSLEKDCARLQTVASLEHLRAQLQDGVPCPLCGAKQHPLPDLGGSDDETHARLEKVRVLCGQTQKALEEQRILQAADRRSLEENSRRQAEQAAVLQELVERQSALGAASALELSAAVPAEQILQQVARRLEETDVACRTAVGLVTRVEAAEKELTALRSALDSAVNTAGQARLALSGCGHQLETAQVAVQRLADENRLFAEALETRLRSLEVEVLPFGEESVTVELLDLVLNRLRARRARWQGFADRRQALEQQLAALNVSLEQEQNRLGVEAQLLQSRQELLQTLENERAALAGQRQELFVGPDPLAEEQRLDRVLAAAGENLKVAETAVAEARKAVDALLAHAARLRTEMTERAARIDALSAAFSRRLQDAGFNAAADFQQALLPEEELLRLGNRERGLDDALTGLLAKLTLVSSQLTEQAALAVTDREPSELEALQQQLQDGLDRLQQEIGAIEQSLRANAEARTVHAELLGGMERQKQESERWGALNRLIGASDGKAFSSFVQNITFEIMLDHANRQLQSMTERYLLVRGKEKSLELNVVDNFQAGEVRPTANLSGGESFLVSLALALGLSRMASENMRVDSLFLDEGFGSLDEDALDMALNTLASLRSEGKLIGIISHVQSIKASISTQIEVIPGSGGRSRLKGPGVKE